jgi:hypothetical protein
MLICRARFRQARVPGAVVRCNGIMLNLSSPGDVIYATNQILIVTAFVRSPVQLSVAAGGQTRNK